MQVILDALEPSGYASNKVSFEGSFTITNQQQRRLRSLALSCEEDYDRLEDVMGEAVKEITCANLSGCEVEILSIDCGARRRRKLKSRGLVAGTNLVVEFIVVLNAYCSDKQCSNGKDVANAIYESVTTTFKESIADGAFVSVSQTSWNFIFHTFLLTNFLLLVSFVG